MVRACHFSIIRAISFDLKRVAPTSAGARGRRTGCHRAGASLDRSQHPGAARGTKLKRVIEWESEWTAGGEGGSVFRNSKSNEEADSEPRERPRDTVRVFGCRCERHSRYVHRETCEPREARLCRLVSRGDCSAARWVGLLVFFFYSRLIG